MVFPIGLIAQLTFSAVSEEHIELLDTPNRTGLLALCPFHSRSAQPSAQRETLALGQLLEESTRFGIEQNLDSLLCRRSFHTHEYVTCVWRGQGCSESILGDQLLHRHCHQTSP